ncbi:MAG: UDP-3-O-(3-hydroxymyristoyl)glucosamine N-acyltransferase [bacterium]
MKISIKDAAVLIGGNIIGNSEIEISNIAKIEEAKTGDITFLYSPAFEKFLVTTQASVIVIKPETKKIREDITYIEVGNPQFAMILIIEKFFTPGINAEGIDPSASIHESVEMGKNVTLGKNVVISQGCKIGDNSVILHNTVLMDNVSVGTGTLIYPNVSIREDCVIGNNVIIHPNSVIGSDGFGFFPTKDGSYKKIPQIGNVIIEDNVELGSNVSIDRAALGSTIIRKGTKLDNLVQIAHNVEVGENTAISAQAGIAGSTKIGKNCIIAGQVGITDHTEIGNKVIIGAQSGITKPILEPGIYSGSPAEPLNVRLKKEVHIRNLNQYAQKISALEKRIAELEKQSTSIKEKEN